MSDPRPGVGHQAPASCCALLRSKSMYVRADEGPGLLRPSNLIHFWCLKTNVDLGPDQHAATHGRCQPSRACYEALEVT